MNNNNDNKIIKALPPMNIDKTRLIYDQEQNKYYILETQNQMEEILEEDFSF